MPNAQGDENQTQRLLDLVAQGDREALDCLLESYRSLIRAFLARRLDTMLQPRLDPSDLVQETQMEIARRVEEYLQHHPMPFRLWVLRIAINRLRNAHRNHHRQRRAIHREVPFPDNSGLLLAGPLLADGSTPSQQLQRRETQELVERAVARLDETDQEILLLRQTEELSYEEIASILDINSAAARKRFGRALLRLRQILKDEGLLEAEP
jgi:RNA polymerase sigma-70 factor, ECF subfamily